MADERVCTSYVCRFSRDLGGGSENRRERRAEEPKRRREQDRVCMLMGQYSDTSMRALDRFLPQRAWHPIFMINNSLMLMPIRRILFIICVCIWDTACRVCCRLRRDVEILQQSI